MDLNELSELFKLIDKYNIRNFCYEDDEKKVKFKKSTSIDREKVSSNNSEPQTMSNQNSIESNQAVTSLYDTKKVHEIVSPMIGNFYRASTAESDNLVQLDSNVQKDTVVCVVEAMKLFSEVEAEVKGKIIEILVEDGELVEFGQPLFRVELE